MKRDVRIVAILFGITVALTFAAEPHTAQDAVQKQVAGLVEQLGSGSYKERRAAAKEIRALEGTALLLALDALEKAADSDDPEIRLQARKLLPDIRGKAGTAAVTARQKAVAKKLKIPLVKEIPLGGNMNLHAILIPDGKFKMGSEDGGMRTKPVHEVKIAKPFYMGAYEVTQAQYEQVMGNNPSVDKGKDLPVVTVSWDEAKEFCAKLSKLSKLDVRLPTEAEWEYACRAGTRTKYYSGDDVAGLAEIAWYNANSGKKAHPVGKKKPNGFGLYDMLGNVWELCEDDWMWGYQNAPEDGSARIGDPRGRDRVIRGGNARLDENCAKSSHRSGTSHKAPSTVYAGFRIVVPLEPEVK